MRREEGKRVNCENEDDGREERKGKKRKVKEREIKEVGEIEIKREGEILEKERKEKKQTDMCHHIVSCRGSGYLN